MTFLQKTLGKNYKWWYLMKFRFKSRNASLFDSFFFVFGHLLVVLGTMLTWYLANNKIIDANLIEKWEYFLVGEFFFGLIYTFPEHMAFNFIRGTHVVDLLRPQNFIQLKLFDCYGESSVQNLIKSSVLSLIFVLFLILGMINIEIYNLLITLLFLPLGLLIIYLSGFILACSGFFLPRVHGISMNYIFVSSLLMGRAFPLNLLIPSFFINLGNPFAFTFYHPMQIYLGKYNPREILLVFGGGIFWCVLLYLLAKIVFQAGLKRNESVGL